MRQASKLTLWVAAASMVVAPLVAWWPGRVWAEELDLERAVVRLRLLEPKGRMTRGEKKRHAAEIERVWAAVEAAGEEGVARLKRELADAAKAKDKGHFFKLNGAALLWRLARLHEANTIAGIWTATPLDSHYHDVFFTALEAAKTQDPRALPLLKACLPDDKGCATVPKQYLTLRWPQTQEVLWGAYGPKGLPELDGILEGAEDPAVVRFALRHLTAAHYLGALGKIRWFIGSKNAAIRHLAIDCVGVFGHPDDYRLLVDGLRSDDPRELEHYARALADFGDVRAVEFLLPLLKSDDLDLRLQAIAALRTLLTRDGFEALRERGARSRDAAERKVCWKTVAHVLGQIRLTWEDYAAKPDAERTALIDGLRRRSQAALALPTGERTLTRDQFLEAAKEWKKAGSTAGGKHGWVDGRHVAAVAKPGDVDLLLAVRAALYATLTDASLDQVATLNTWIRRLGRSRYRRAPGICDRVELK